MKIRTIMGSLLVGALLLTSVPMADLGGLTAKAEGAGEEPAAYERLAIASGTAPREHTQTDRAECAVDDNLSTKWQTDWGSGIGGTKVSENGTDTTYPRNGYYDFTSGVAEGDNTYTITLRDASTVGYIEYVGRTGNVNGLIRTLKVEVKGADGTWKEAPGKYYDGSGNPCSNNMWPDKVGTDFASKYEFDEPQTGVREIKVTCESAWTNKTAGHIVATEFRVYGKEDTSSDVPLIESKRYEADESGQFVIPDEDMAFFNSLKGATITALFRFNSAPTLQDTKNYALFTLAGEGSKFFTLWYNPFYNGVGDITYSYNGSKSGLVFNKTGFTCSDTDWHKITVSFDGEGGTYAAYFDDKPVSECLDSFGSKANDHWGTIFSGGYTGASVGKTAENGVYQHYTVHPFPGTIKYVEIARTTYANAALIKESVHSREYAGEFGTDIASLEDALKDLDEDDYRADSWNVFKAAKDAADGVDASTDLGYLNKTLKLNEAISASEALQVCHHVYLNGKCIKCDAVYRSQGIVGTGVTKYVVKTKVSDTAEVETRDADYGEVCSVEAEAVSGGRNFSHWSSEENGAAVLSRNVKYDFYVSRSMGVYAVYKEGEAVSEPCIANNNGYSKDVASAKYVNFEFTRDVPQDWDLVEQGVLYGTSASQFGGDGADANLRFSDDGSKPKEKVWKYKGTSSSKRGVYIVTLNIGDNTSGTVYARGYVIAEKDGVRQIFYSPVASGSYDSLPKLSELN